MNRSELTYNTAHAFIRRRQRKEFLSLSLLVGTILTLLISTSAFISFNKDKSGLALNESTHIEQVTQEHTAAVDENDTTREIITIEELVSSEETEEESLPLFPEQEDVPQEDTPTYSSNSPPAPSMEKPVISSKIAKLIQATSPSQIDISMHYTVLG